ncbi:hypothetical protein SAMN06265222_12124 [Neorhodopirellula lusitana]|uniref:Secreted protein n=1 Tax=Neorhodopirellula lusitana TaxID=445327 RepID=A0ABY1QPK2_9BACT|nr:hypothetical protein SAMN06265222_12124 [Neorhodopirellula lusitana]
MGSLAILLIHLLRILLLASFEFQQKVTSNAADNLCLVATTTARDQSGHYKRQCAYRDGLAGFLKYSCHLD